MSFQFGIWNRDGAQLQADDFAKVTQMTDLYGSPNRCTAKQNSVGMFFRPFETWEDADHPLQPLLNMAGVALTYDGRIDNREDLIRAGGLRLSTAASDAQIVLAAYERWHIACLRRLLGDWALAIWDPREQYLLLAKDFAGVRPLFYSLERNRLMWSTAIDPLVFLSAHPFRISEEYVAGYLSTFPPTHLSPYVGVQAVSPGCYVKVSGDSVTTHRYWAFDSRKRIRYRHDSEYEEHFRTAFFEAVRRRLRSSMPVLAELSGGMDSSAVVSVADALLRMGKTACPRLNTVSYYDDNEPNWHERPYFSLVEAKRGRKGYHIDVSGCEGAFEPVATALRLPVPGYDKLAADRLSLFHHCIGSSRSRLLLRGIGGDEFLGGVPNPIPELQGLLVHLRWLSLFDRLFAWSLTKRRPWVHLLFETGEEFLPQAIRRTYKRAYVAPWISDDFLSRNADIFWADTGRVPLTLRPEFSVNSSALAHLNRLIGCFHLNGLTKHLVSYPYLDRDLLEFLFAIPRDQLVRPGERRSLMRRALREIVPTEILSRKRKAFVERRPLILVGHARLAARELLESSLTADAGWVDRRRLTEELEKLAFGHVQFIIPLIAVLKLERWLRDLAHCGVLDGFAQRADVESPQIDKPSICLAARRSSTVTG